MTSPGEAPPPSRRCRWADFQLAEDRQTDSMAATGQGAVEKETGGKRVPPSPRFLVTVAQESTAAKNTEALGCKNHPNGKVTHSFPAQIFILHFLCTRLCARSCKVNKLPPALMKFIILLQGQTEQVMTTKGIRGFDRGAQTASSSENV